MRKTVAEYTAITLGGFLYALGVHFFIFAGDIVLGGTGGISVILEQFLPFSPNDIITVINLLLLLFAFLFLGRSMGMKTLVGTLATTLGIWALGIFADFSAPPIQNTLLAGAVGALIIAAASAILFSVDGSSGGTDILALIVRRYSGMNIGRALFFTDILIVAVGGFLLGAYGALCSALAFLIKVVGIELLVAAIKRRTKNSKG